MLLQFVLVCSISMSGKCEKCEKNIGFGHFDGGRMLQSYMHAETNMILIFKVHISA
jgi:hypothetical protein